MTLEPGILAFLSEPGRFASLATINVDGAPQQTVMWFMTDGETIVMNTARGRLKDRNLLSDNRASVCVEDGYRYVAIAGRVEMIEEQGRTQADIKALATRYSGAEEAEKMMLDSFGRQERVTLLLSIDHVDAHGF